MRHTSALTPNPVPRYSPAAPAELATRVAVTSRSMATLTRHPSRSSRARSERPMPIKSTRDAFAARSKNVVTLPTVTTFFDRAANASLVDLIGIGRSLLARLEREGCRVNVAIEREVTATRVANSAGAAGEYRGTGFGVSADVWRIAGDDVLVVSDAFEGADLPSDVALAALVASINARLDHALRVVAAPEGALPVVFTPAGLSALMLPVTQALSGKAVLQGISPLEAKVGEQAFDPRFSLTDDPLHGGRIASRPLDDECVPSRTLALVDGGVRQRFIYDLETAARAKTRSTGNGQRGIFGKPVPAYTNIVLNHVGALNEVGAQHAAPLQLGGGLLGDIRDGLLVDELIGVGQGNVTGWL